MGNRIDQGRPLSWVNSDPAGSGPGYNHPQMPADWERKLKRWLGEGLIEPTTVQKILDFERTSRGRRGLRWPIVLALSFGSLLIGAGVLLFVSAHWDALSPAQRMSVVVGVVALFHLGGAWFTDRFRGLSYALHALGTIALGGGIALTGQIFHLAEHWPSGILLWTLGAAAGCGFSRTGRN